MRKLLDYTMTSGRHRVVWDGRSDDGLVLRTGVYFVSLHTGRERFVRRLLLLR
ncbi:MAG: hypothetical protein VYB08_05205 [Candidatus Latescibacterota bacterium]|nr:hypothetical protein [Candidatus Latescibacterota bacterium]MEE3042437.1 hypothetical protein [Candidatus Latescibacterota bacterium]